MADIFGFELDFGLGEVAATDWGFWLLVIGLIIICLIIAAVGILMWISAKTYNKKIIIFENLAGQGYQPTGKDRARIVKVGDGGEELLFLKKRKLYRTAYGRKMGKNTFWFCVGQDGYWYNVLLGDLDAKMGMLDIEPVDRDMRYMHVAIRKNIQERYRKQSFMEKYGVMVTGAVFLFIMVIAIWLLLSQIGDMMNQASSVIQSTKPIADALSNAVGKLDSLCAGGSGISPA